MILVDTSVWIEYFKKKLSNTQKRLDWLIQNAPDEICLNGVILTEVLQGVRDESLYMKLRDNMMVFRIINNDDVSTYLFAAEIFRKCRKKGITVRSTIDTLIAATSIENKCEIFSLDRDFLNIAKVVDLRIYG
ncbi:PIN domain nuclease [Patescibacteria group bacterium]|nr:PIN domain nuclease [Patescibacteria group bacterium]